MKSRSAASMKSMAPTSHSPVRVGRAKGAWPANVGNLAPRYVSLLNESYTCFASVRQKMILPAIAKRLQELSAAGTPTSKDLVVFARSAISFTRSVCLDEFELFYAYFAGERGDTEV